MFIDYWNRKDSFPPDVQVVSHWGNSEMFCVLAQTSSDKDMIADVLSFIEFH